MLGVKSYAQDYIDACRAKVASDVAAYEAIAKAAKGAAAPFEAVFFNNMVVVLDTLFTHRLRGLEGKDGNPLNEVRMLSASLVENTGRLAADKTIKWMPETSVLGLGIGDAIAVTAADFARLAEAYFAEIEKKFR